MKKLIIIIFLLFVIYGCGKKEQTKLEAFSPDAYAFNIGDSYEVNATVRTKGFVQEKDNNKYKIYLDYKVDLINPNGEKIENISSGFVDKSSVNKLTDIPIEVQFHFDTTSTKGNYKLIFHITDKYSNQIAHLEKDFLLE